MKRGAVVFIALLLAACLTAVLPDPATEDAASLEAPPPTLAEEVAPVRAVPLTPGAAAEELTFSPDGRLLAVFDGKGTTIWDASPATASSSSPVRTRRSASR